MYEYKAKRNALLTRSFGHRSPAALDPDFHPDKMHAMTNQRDKAV
jgi:hypothetical protein